MRQRKRQRLEEGRGIDMHEMYRSWQYEPPWMGSTGMRNARGWSVSAGAIEATRDRPVAVGAGRSWGQPVQPDSAAWAGQAWQPAAPVPPASGMGSAGDGEGREGCVGTGRGSGGRRRSREVVWAAARGAAPGGQWRERAAPPGTAGRRGAALRLSAMDPCTSPCPASLGEN